MILQKPVKHYFSRDGHEIKGIVLHTGEGNKNQILDWFLSPKSQVSSHYLVCEDGEVWQFVNEKDAAWGSGKIVNPTSELLKENEGINPNKYLLQIEHEGYARNGINEVQYESTAELIKGIRERWNIPMDRKHIIRHQEINDDKLCPGFLDANKVIKIVNRLIEDEKPKDERNILLKLASTLWKWFKDWISFILE